MKKIVLMGIGATLTMDLWGLVLSLFGIKGLNFAYLGRWVLQMRELQWFHPKISLAVEVPNELVVGWIVHYGIGVSLSFLFYLWQREKWQQEPILWPALVFGLVTTVAPLLILQPALGGGYFFMNTPQPVLLSLKSTGSHVIFGIGLYLSALALKRLPST